MIIYLALKSETRTLTIIQYFIVIMNSMNLSHYIFLYIILLLLRI